MTNESKINHCSFCGLHKDKVKKLIVSDGVAICSDCIDLCNNLIKDDSSIVESEPKHEEDIKYDISQISNISIVKDKYGNKCFNIFVTADCTNWLDHTDVILIELHGNCEKLFYQTIESQSFQIPQLGKNVVLIRGG